MITKKQASKFFEKNNRSEANQQKLACYFINLLSASLKVSFLGVVVGIVELELCIDEKFLEALRLSLGVRILSPTNRLASFSIKNCTTPRALLDIVADLKIISEKPCSLSNIINGVKTMARLVVFILFLSECRATLERKFKENFKISRFALGKPDKIVLAASIFSVVLSRPKLLIGNKCLVLARRTHWWNLSPIIIGSGNSRKNFLKISAIIRASHPAKIPFLPNKSKTASSASIFSWYLVPMQAQLLSVQTRQGWHGIFLPYPVLYFQVLLHTPWGWQEKYGCLVPTVVPPRHQTPWTYWLFLRCLSPKSFSLLKFWLKTLRALLPSEIPKRSHILPEHLHS